MRGHSLPPLPEVGCEPQGVSQALGHALQPWEVEPLMHVKDRMVHAPPTSCHVAHLQSWQHTASLPPSPGLPQTTAKPPWEDKAKEPPHEPWRVGVGGPGQAVRPWQVAWLLAPQPSMRPRHPPQPRAPVAFYV